MAVTSFLYGPALQSAFGGEINFLTSAAKAMLATSAYTPNQDTHRYKSSVTGEVVGTGYTARGVALTTKTAAYTAATNTLALDCDDPSWATATITARYVIFYMDTGTDATSALISYVDLGADVSSTGAAWTYQVPAAGFATFTAA